MNSNPCTGLLGRIFGHKYVEHIEHFSNDTDNGIYEGEKLLAVVCQRCGDIAYCASDGEDECDCAVCRMVAGEPQPTAEDYETALNDDLCGGCNGKDAAA